MLERQREGIAKAKCAGRYRSRADRRAKSANIVKLAGEGVKREEVAARLGVGVGSIACWRSKRRQHCSSASCSGLN
jgi:hypothetical protein